VLAGFKNESNIKNNNVNNTTIDMRRNASLDIMDHVTKVDSG